MNRKEVISGHLMISVVLILSIILIGTIGYVLLESVSPFEALYHTVISITTVGYSDIATKNSTRIFTILIVLSGVAAFYYFAGAIIEGLITGRLFEVLKVRKMEEGLANAADHVILCGYGDVGGMVAEKVKNVVVIEKDIEKFNDLTEKGFLAVRGDSTNPQVLQSAGIDRARAMIIALDSDQIGRAHV
jgi:voltage-gated potassium channel